MSVIDGICNRLKEYPSARFRADPNIVTVRQTSEDGFSVAFEVVDSGYRVSLDGWHEEFTSEEDALNCFAFGLSAECRLREVSHGGFPHKWTVECLRDGVWRGGSTTGLLLFPFFLPKKVRILQNGFIQTA